MLVFSTVAGGIGSAAMGGNFWQGAVNGLIVGALNHLKHKGQVKLYKDIHKGLKELWVSSQEQGSEMAGYYTEKGLVIAWEKDSGPTYTEIKGHPIEGKDRYYRVYGGKSYKINGVVHTHPNIWR